MKLELEQQVVSLELARTMRELGFPQESLFYWVDDGTIELHDWTVVKDTWTAKTEKVSAYTVAELGELLKDTNFALPVYQRGAKRWAWQENQFKEWLYADTEANIRSKELIYLKQHNLI